MSEWYDNQREPIDKVISRRTETTKIGENVSFGQNFFVEKLCVNSDRCKVRDCNFLHFHQNQMIVAGAPLVTSNILRLVIQPPSTEYD